MRSNVRPPKADMYIGSSVNLADRFRDRVEDRGAPKGLHPRLS